jgi:DNA-binding transcriptional MerR regulator
MSTTKALTVRAVARLTKISIRTLHHYDEIGLFRPAARTAAGYRLYSQEDLERLQQILLFRELGFPLEEIRRIVTHPNFDVAAALVKQRELLVERVGHLHRILGAVDRALAARGDDAMSTPATPEEMFEVFGGEPAAHQQEAQRRWGDSEAFRESKRRAAGYRKEQWQEMKAEAEQITLALAEVMTSGAAADSAAAIDVAERHRQHVERWFYPCPAPLHAGLGRLYVDDARFAAHFDGVRAGLASYASVAWQANAARSQQAKS